VASAVDVVIVHYDTPEHLRRCLALLCASPDDSVQKVVVVDNASPDRSVEAFPAVFPAVRFIFNRTNLGFAAGCNQGIAAGSSSLCLLLNPDALITAETLAALRVTMATQETAGVVAPRLVNPDGALQLSCRRFPTLLAVFLRALRLDRLCPAAVNRYLMRDADHATALTVDWAIGACLLLRRAALEEVGLLDEAFFMYYEDTDLCRRMQSAGWKVFYEPAAVVQHEHRRESASLIPRRATRAHVHSLFRLFRKHRFPLW
jgi:GT2 family glycosyltransferase